VPLSVIWYLHAARRRLRTVSHRQAIRPQADYRLPASPGRAAAAFPGRLLSRLPTGKAYSPPATSSTARTHTTHGPFPPGSWPRSSTP